MTRAEAFRLLREVLDCVDNYDGGAYLGERDRFLSMFDTAADDEAVVREHGAELADLTEIEDREELREWVGFVRPSVLERIAYEVNEAADNMGAATTYVVYGGMVVPERGVVHRDLLARTPQPVRVAPRP